MANRPLWFCIAWAWVGCQTGIISQVCAASGPADLLWQQGQEAMRQGRFQDAVLLYERSLRLDPKLTRSHLSLAAAYLEQGNTVGACAHLGRYVQTNPRELTIRIHLADLKLRLHRLLDARTEFERCVACAQEGSSADDGQLLHCHARLMEIAEAMGDAYHEHLHRGIGLALLARQRARYSANDEGPSVESLLCKAAGELTLAHIDQPDEARPSWYLYTVWTSLGQRQPALRCLKQAADSSPFCILTSAERSRLHLHWQCASAGSSVR